ncbi:hypothetical protein HOP50_14g71520 [Chloropicon primus]|uniref:RWP-RK domain-containing protein n=1 Tax=Chloropicon primus TaxID=1764295 RepID=A0A5B8MYY6_9CHLO|nr:hypothetical protein A3770_14p71320 [Chloropicon primus]UPR03822.1 hypothetical protein HOP50_14g71520 [Chloropicon primus]|eukprot:QDZ24614.1 hypothetical protein A3770_14p71320 [Chloropicon primus]
MNFEEREIPLDALVEASCLPLPEAAERLGVSVYALKSQWEKARLGEWPYDQKTEYKERTKNNADKGAVVQQDQCKDDLIKKIEDDTYKRLMTFRENVKAVMSYVTTTTPSTLPSLPAETATQAGAPSSYRSSHQQEVSVVLPVTVTHKPSERGRPAYTSSLSQQGQQQQGNHGNGGGSGEAGPSNGPPQGNGEEKMVKTPVLAGDPRVLLSSTQRQVMKVSVQVLRDTFKNIIGNCKGIATVLDDDGCMEMIDSRELVNIGDKLVGANAVLEQQVQTLQGHHHSYQDFLNRHDYEYKSIARLEKSLVDLKGKLRDKVKLYHHRGMTDPSIRVAPSGADNESKRAKTS